MIDIKRIFPECNVDTLLVQLILKRGNANHNKGINKVATAIKNYDSGDFVIGLVDTDKFVRNPDYFVNFIVIYNRIKEEGLIILKHPNENKYLIRIDPAFEKWIMKLAEEMHIPLPAEFDTFDKLKKAAKDDSIVDNSKFKKFLNKVINSNHPAVQTITNWLLKVDVIDER